MARSQAALTFALVFFAGNAVSAETPAAVENAGIKAFLAICVRTAPSFSAAAAAAAEHGITDLVDSGGSRLGMTDDGTLTVQIAEGKKCVVTTPAQADKKLTQTFLEAVASEAGQPAAKRVPAKVTVGGKQFVLMHDRNDGETFVMLSTER